VLVWYHVRSNPKHGSLPGTPCCCIIRAYCSFPWCSLRNGTSSFPRPPVCLIGHTRCGKLYKTDKIDDPPGGQFPVPASLHAPQLALRCNPALIPFLPDDTSISSTVILVDTLVRTTDVNGAQPLGTIRPSQDTELLVKVFLNGKNLTSGKVPLNGSATLPFNLSKLSPRIRPYDLTCTATLSSSPGTFHSIPTN